MKLIKPRQGVEDVFDTESEGVVGYDETGYDGRESMEKPEPVKKPSTGKERKGKNTRIFIMLGVVGVLIAGGLFAKVFLGAKEEPSKVAIEVEKAPVVEKEPEILEKEPEEKPVVKEGYDYESGIVGISLNYNTQMYLKENTDEIFNRIKAVEKQGDTFDITSDALLGELEVIKLSTGEDDTLDARVTVVPHGKEKDIKIDALDGLAKESEELGKGREYMEETYVSETEQGIEVVVSERKYTDKEGRTVEYMHGIVPVGANAVIVSVSTDGTPMKIDKYKLFDEMVQTVMIHKIEEKKQEEARKEEEQATSEKVKPVEGISGSVEAVKKQSSGVVEVNMELEIRNGKAVERKGVE